MSDRRSFLKSLIGLPLLPRLGAGRATFRSFNFKPMVARLGEPTVGTSLTVLNPARVDLDLLEEDVFRHDAFDQVGGNPVAWTDGALMSTPHDDPRRVGGSTVLPTLWKRFNPDLGDGCLAGLDEYINDHKEPS